jgi:hypothetical protein
VTRVGWILTLSEDPARQRTAGLFRYNALVLTAKRWTVVAVGLNPR